MNSGEQLCLACGLCCDGTLFGHVRLGPGDEAKELRALGLPVIAPRGRAGAGFARFRQPCAALCADGACRVYAERPAQCRSFECGVFQEAAARRITMATARRRVRHARRRAEEIRGLLRELGDDDSRVALTQRFLRVQRRMNAGAADAAQADAFARLTVAMQRFSVLTRKNFFTEAAQP